jgi:hypothetical protein
MWMWPDLLRAWMLQYLNSSWFKLNNVIVTILCCVAHAGCSGPAVGVA